jgi:hypothetical protein
LKPVFITNFGASVSNEMLMTVLGVRETRESNGHINGWINHNGGINPEMKALMAAA